MYTQFTYMCIYSCIKIEKLVYAKLLCILVFQSCYYSVFNCYFLFSLVFLNVLLIEIKSANRQTTSKMQSILSPIDLSINKCQTVISACLIEGTTRYPPTSVSNTTPANRPIHFHACFLLSFLMSATFLLLFILSIVLPLLFILMSSYFKYAIFINLCDHRLIKQVFCFLFLFTNIWTMLTPLPSI